MNDHSMVQECVDSYRVEREPDGGIRITIRAPKRFAELWLVKLSELRATPEELG
jgi:hypothetical protein